MTEIDDFTIAFQNVNKFENYRFLKSWGIMLIIFGVSAVISNTRWFLLYFFNRLFQIEYGQAALIIRFLLFTIDILILPILLIIMIYSFKSVKKTSITDSRVISYTDIRFGLALLTLYLISPRLSLFFTIPISVHIPEIIGTLLAFLLMRNSIKLHHFKELLYLTLIFTLLTAVEIFCNLLSILFFFNSDYFILIHIAYSLFINICFMICYIVIGRYSLRKASNILESIKTPN